MDDNMTELATNPIVKPRHYALIIAAMVAVALLDYSFPGSTIELAFLKALSIPVLVLATFGVQKLFYGERAFQRWTFALVERVVALSLVEAAGITFMLAQIDSSLAYIVTVFACAFVLAALITIFGPQSRL
jgi:hypothetical protein